MKSHIKIKTIILVLIRPQRLDFIKILVPAEFPGAGQVNTYKEVMNPPAVCVQSRNDYKQTRVVSGSKQQVEVMHKLHSPSVKCIPAFAHEAVAPYFSLTDS